MNEREGYQSEYEDPYEEFHDACVSPGVVGTIEVKCPRCMNCFRDFQDSLYALVECPFCHYEWRL